MHHSEIYRNNCKRQEHASPAFPRAHRGPKTFLKRSDLTNNWLLRCTLNTLTSSHIIEFPQVGPSGGLREPPLGNTPRRHFLGRAENTRRTRRLLKQAKSFPRRRKTLPRSFQATRPESSSSRFRCLPSLDFGKFEILLEPCLDKFGLVFADQCSQIHLNS